MLKQRVEGDTSSNLVHTPSRTRVNHPVQPLSLWTGLGWRRFQGIELGRGSWLAARLCMPISITRRCLYETKPWNGESNWGGVVMADACIDRR
jgi:hypothetical protein